MTFGLDEQGNWKEEKAKDTKEPSDTAPAGGQQQQQQQQQQQHKTARDKDASSLSSSQDGTTTDNSRVVHRHQHHQHHDNVGDDGDGDDGDHPINEFEIEINEGEDAKGLADILRAAGYDVEIAELDKDGKYTIQNFDDDDYAETETNDGEQQAGTKRKHRGNDQQQPPNGGHDEL